MMNTGYTSHSQKTHQDLISIKNDSSSKIRKRSTKFNETEFQKEMKQNVLGHIGIRCFERPSAM